ncbi:CLUMA_CG004872, isoform A [Clunio marinus]|uniref:CLUMA_CG004872, isoform A n=1 Tax=Clunio marinus TaxID=568069 RepID=A0A1J1HT60_9DIPT|nr:CLUMA_CG004872, isoform A [Clunio marinus]
MTLLCLMKELFSDHCSDSKRSMQLFVLNNPHVSFFTLNCDRLDLRERNLTASRCSHLTKRSHMYSARHNADDSLIKTFKIPLTCLV